MATELITFKLEPKFLKEVDTLVEKSSYSSRTDLIRDALREKIEETKLKQAMIELSKMRGKAKRKVTDAEIHKAREAAFEKLAAKLK